jgi:hypothetical protein
MAHKVTINIDALLPQLAENKAKAIETIANTLDQDTLNFMAQLCQEKGRSINNSLRSNSELIRKHL